MMRVRVTYADGHVEVVTLAASAFGLEGTLAHGEVRSATPIAGEVESDLPREMRRSLRLAPVPIYGTGRNR